MKGLFSAASCFGRQTAFARTRTQIRTLYLHEYQSQQLLRNAGVRFPEFRVASSSEEARKLSKELGSKDLVLKAQVLTGGRGKGVFESGLKGGVQICHSATEVVKFARKMINYKLVTKQTGAEGKLCSKVMVAKRHYLRREMYFSITLDRKTASIVLIGSPRGGMDIETVAKETPESIFKVYVDLATGVTQEQLETMAKHLGFREKSNIAEAVEQMQLLYESFINFDCTLLEINPFAEDSDGHVICVDAKMNFDDNAAFRQKAIFAQRDFSQEDSREVAAAKHDLNFIGLDGSIGCLVNGAGLAMATLDIIKLYGGSPANFLDVGGGATEQQVTEALRIIASDPKVKSILVNIFGGIMRCDVIALGIINAAQILDLKIPIVVRLQGTNVKEAERLLECSNLRLLTATDLDDAAKKAVQVADIVSLAEKAKLNVHFELPL